MSNGFLYFLKFSVLGCLMIFLIAWQSKFFPSALIYLVFLLFYIQYRIFYEKDTSVSFKLAASAFLTPVTLIIVVVYCFFQPNETDLKAEYANNLQNTIANSGAIVAKRVRETS